MYLLSIKTVMIDLDSTFVDVLADFEAALDRVLADFQVLEANRSLVERSIGKGSEHLICKSSAS